MLFTSLVLLVVGYTMLYSALHGRWEFWRYFFPSKRVPTLSSTPASAVA
jgi:hypothetical protein